MSVLTLSAPFSQSSVASLLASCVHLLAMSVSYTFQPTLARHAVKCCFPRKTAEPPKVPIAADEPKDDSFDPTVYLLNLQVSLDGSKIAVVTSNAEVRVYASESISLISQMTGHSATVTDVKFSDSDANVLVTSSDDGSVCVWDVKTGAKTATYTGMNKPISIPLYRPMQSSCPSISMPFH
jgi:WD40 repeat protein